MSQKKDESRATYLGDGVYASYDGYHILLHVGAHTNHPVVALEPTVLRNLDNYRQVLQQEFNDAQARGQDDE